MRGTGRAAGLGLPSLLADFLSPLEEGEQRRRAAEEGRREVEEGTPNAARSRMAVRRWRGGLCHLLL